MGQPMDWPGSRPGSARRGSISVVIAVRNSRDKSTIDTIHGGYEADNITDYDDVCEGVQSPLILEIR
ncbi:hypothetical protein WN55_02805 [Dufourea novaeangliae]|uniref:Uncharacterized protein n=1 Tax=Dufourea novaeangliae TaxID=178035 RepID=A0A154NY10_DUFNO|nr:hypothetical protein WN55_02805 [Dufourea novaeangliae]